MAERFLLALGAAGVSSARTRPDHAGGAGWRRRLYRTADSPVRSTASGTPWNGRTSTACRDGSRSTQKLDRAAQAAAADEIVIRTWIHVLRADTTVAGGRSRAWIDDQIDVLGTVVRFGRPAGTTAGFQFELAGVTRTTNADWFDMHSQGQDRRWARAEARRAAS